MLKLESYLQRAPLSELRLPLRLSWSGVMASFFGFFEPVICMMLLIRYLCNDKWERCTKGGKNRRKREKVGARKGISGGGACDLVTNRRETNEKTPFREAVSQWGLSPTQVKI